MLLAVKIEYVVFRSIGSVDTEGFSSPSVGQAKLTGRFDSIGHFSYDTDMAPIDLFGGSPSVRIIHYNSSDPDLHTCPPPRCK